MAGKRFWLYRPFSRVVTGDRDERTVKNYVHINEWEAHGYPRHFARFLAAMWGRGPEPKPKDEYRAARSARMKS